MAGVAAQRPTTMPPPPPIPHSDPTRTSLATPQASSSPVDAAVERLATQFRVWSDPVELFALCLSLSRDIDNAILSSEIPSSARKLPMLLKKVCYRENEPKLQAAVMVLMFSVKNACMKGWFLLKDAKELLSLANEVRRSFCSAVDISIEPSSLHVVVTNVLLRFIPWMKMDNVLASLKVKPGYGAYPVDFHLLKDTLSDSAENIFLLVVCSDSILTSSCLISPPKASFLINGIGIRGRDTGPQLPTMLKPILTPGTNILQVIGEFSGNYIVAICCMTQNTSSEVSALQDYVHPVAAACESDSEILEGSSRISLNCPISFTRIKTPVKGQLCKHHQCFDFENYVGINARRPSWRCPQCNQSVCYRDLRIDRNMVKILAEAAKNVVDIVLSADGSWKPLMEVNDQTEANCDRTVGSEQCTSAKPSNTILDLTMDEFEVNAAMDICDTEDVKPFKDAHHVPLEKSNSSELHSHSFAEPPLVPEISNTFTDSQNLVSQAEDDFWSGIFVMSPATSSRSASPDISGLPTTNPTTTPVLTNAVSLASNREFVDVRGTSQVTSSTPQTQSSDSGNLQLQHPQVGNSLTTESGRSIPRYVSRNPVSAHTLGAPSQTPASHSWCEVERQQHLSRSHLSSSSTPGINSSSMHGHSNSPNWNHQDRHRSRSPPRQAVGLPLTGDGRLSSGIPSEHHSARTNGGTLQATRRPPTVLPSTYVPPVSAQQRGTPGAAASSHNLPPMASVHRSSQAAKSPTVASVQLQQPRAGSSIPRATDGSRTSVGDHRGTNMGPGSTDAALNGLPSGQNWRPTGRMRGSLTGRAYSEALIQLMIQPTNSNQATRPK